MEQKGELVEVPDQQPEFLGTYHHSLDAKGRLVLPATHRDHLEEGLVMTIGMDHCLQVFPRSEWARVREGLRRLRTTDRRERMFARMVTGQAHPESLDRQGRITIPPRLREYARLDREVAIVGLDSRLELWDLATWEGYEQDAMSTYAETSESFDVGIF